MNSKLNLIEKYTENQLNKMSIEDLKSFFYDRFYSECQNMTISELRSDVAEYAPELLKE